MTDETDPIDIKRLLALGIAIDRGHAARNTLNIASKMLVRFIAVEDLGHPRTRLSQALQELDEVTGEVEGLGGRSVRLQAVMTVISALYPKEET